MTRTVTNRRQQQRRRRQQRRKTDFYYETGKLAGLVAFVCIAIIGQAELIGEPWRHYVTVTATVSAAVWAYGMQPKGVIQALKAYRGGR